MKLDRNTNAKGRGKYALILNRRVVALPKEQRDLAINAISQLTILGVIDQGDSPDREFFVIRLKDKYATAALCAYAKKAFEDDQMEYGGEIMQLADRAEVHPSKKRPD